MKNVPRNISLLILLAIVTMGQFPGVFPPIVLTGPGPYTIAPNHCKRVVQFGTGTSGLMTVTLPAVTGFPVDCSIIIKNGDNWTGRGKSLLGFPPDFTPAGNSGEPSILWPLQAGSFGIVNAAWATLVPAGRAKNTTGVPLQVNHGSGSDTNSDGLGTGSGAFATIGVAKNVIRDQFDCNANANIQLAIETFTENVVVLDPVCPGAHALAITGNPSLMSVFTGSITGSVLTVSSVTSGTIDVGVVIAGLAVNAGTQITSRGSGSGGTGTYNLNNSQSVASEIMTGAGTIWQPSGNGAIALTGFDGAEVIVNGVKCQSPSSGATGQTCFFAGKGGGLVEWLNVEFGPVPNGTHATCGNGGTLNYGGGTYTVSGSMGQHFYMNSGCSANILNVTVNVPNALTFANWAQVQFGASLINTATFTGAGAGAGSTGTKYSVTYNGSAQLNGGIFPGATAGVTSNGGQVQP